MSHIDPGAPLTLWAKGAPTSSADPYHPLACHLLDVAAVALQLWESVLPSAARRWMAAGLGLCEEEAGRWVALCAGLHDLGKAAPAFQLQTDQARFRELNRTWPHGIITAQVLSEILTEAPFGLPPILADQIAVVVGGHHGTFPRSEERVRLSSEALGDRAWSEARKTLAAWIAEAVDLPLARPSNATVAQLLWLAGLVSVADWIGSDSRFFPYASEAAAASSPIDADYWLRARRGATEALESLGWRSLGDIQSLQFEELFGVPAPRPVQQAAIELAEQLDGPALIVVEAPMGEGKTEAALYLADRASVDDGLGGHYIALPTRATSDQMHDRVRAFLARRYPAQVINLQLLHGQAALADAPKDLERLPRPEGIAGPPGWDGAEALVLAEEWFTQRKRGLLAPFGVGTVDQALLGVLQTRHVFVRLFGLAHKTVIVDEVHAYDTYMSALLERLLTWLAALGCRVVLLSATLPRARRERLLRAYQEGLATLLGSKDGAAMSPGENEAPAPYPRLTWITSEEASARPVGISDISRKNVAVRWLSGASTAELGLLLTEALANGGCAAVICNTVRRAQETYRALKEWFGGTASDGGPELDLLHARFLHKDREVREQRALARFGKDASQRPRRAVLVATQVIEQSLDLDFDVMVTELAPADLILQRIGRLHRHDRERPPGMGQAEVWILPPPEEDGAPTFDAATTYVYDEHVLLRSWLELRERTMLRVPDDIEALVEAVYDDSRPCPDTASERFRKAWGESWHRLELKRQEEIGEAQKRWMKAPSYRGAIWRLTSESYEEDAPDLHRELQALTRLADPSVDMICLFGDENQARTEPDASEAFTLRTTVDTALARSLLRNSVRLSGRRIVQELMAREAPASWKKSSLLRHCRPLLFDESRSARIGSYRIYLDPEVGIEMVTESEGGWDAKL